MIRRNKRNLIRAALFIFLIIVLPAKIMAQVDQDVLKAVYIERITRFVEWPAENKFDSDSVIVFGILNNPEFANKIEKIFQTQKLKNRLVEVRRISNIEEISHCHICIVDKINSEELETVILEANLNGILLFSHEEKGGKRGVHFNFYLEDGKLKFEINEKSVNSAGFKISHLLMKSARII